MERRQLSLSLITEEGAPGENLPGTARLFLFRHGLTQYNIEKRYQGSSDLPIVKEEAKRIRPFFPEAEERERTRDAVYVSPALRARQTAALLFPDAEQIVIPEFREMDFGIFEGRSADEMASDPQYRRWVDSMCEGPVPGGESLEQFRKRVTERFESLAAQVLSEGGRDLLIVAPGGTQMAVMERFCTRKRPYWSWQSPPGEAVRAVITAKAR